VTRGWDRDPDPRLPTRPLVGRFAIADSVLDSISTLLPTYRGPDGDHEGIVFLLGYEMTNETVLVTAVAPNAEHGRGRVHVSRENVLAVSKLARSLGLGVLAQVHSHPAGWTEHSVGDDGMVLMRFEGMLSIVVPHYGRYGLRPLDGLGVHQWQHGGWVACERVSIREGIRVLPSWADLR
jgi:hypothetical protein